MFDDLEMADEHVGEVVLGFGIMDSCVAPERHFTIRVVHGVICGGDGPANKSAL